MYKFIIFIIILIHPIQLLAECNCTSSFSDRTPKVSFIGRVVGKTSPKNWPGPGQKYTEGKFWATFEVERFTSFDKFKDQSIVKLIKKRKRVFVDSVTKANDCRIKFEVGKRYNINVSIYGKIGTMERWGTNACNAKLAM